MLPQQRSAKSLAAGHRFWSRQRAKVKKRAWSACALSVLNDHYSDFPRAFLRSFLTKNLGRSQSMPPDTIQPIQDVLNRWVLTGQALVASIGALAFVLALASIA
jgi:hypothetical protein